MLLKIIHIKLHHHVEQDAFFSKPRFLTYKAIDAHLKN